MLILPNEFDQFIKHKVKAKYYVRYADDFVVLLQDRKLLENILLKMKVFLQNKLKLNLHPHKVSIETFSSGVDYLGWLHFPTHRVLRTVTKKRMFKRIIETRDTSDEVNGQAEGKEETKQSYLGLLNHGDTYGLQKKVFELSDGFGN